MTNNHTLQQVLDIIRQQATPVTRAKIAKELNTNRTSISSAVSELMHLGLVQENERENHSNGRPGITLSLHGKEWYACGAVFEENSWIIIIADLLGSIVCRHIEHIGSESTTPAASEAVTLLIAGLRKTLQHFHGRLLPKIGIGVPGFINRKQGLIQVASDLHWENVHITDIVKEATGYDADIINRHHAAALAESRLGAGKGYDNIVYVGISTGIIASQVSRGELIIGKDSNAGEIGHTIIDPNGPRCTCGKQGCLHSVASESALINSIISHYRALDGQNDPIASAIKAGKTPSLIHIMEAIRNNPDAPCMQEIQKFVTYIGIECTNLMNMLNPDIIVLGGPMNCLFTEKPYALLETTIRQYIFPHPYIPGQIKLARLGKFGGPLGASMLATDDMLALAEKAMNG